MLSAMDVERSVLGSIISEESLKYKIDELNEDLFVGNDHQRIFRIIKDLYKKEKSVDVATIMSVIDADKNINSDIRNTNVILLSQLVAGCNAFIIDSHIKTLKETYIKNGLMKLVVNITRDIASGKDIPTVINSFEKGTKVLMEDDALHNDSIKDIAHDAMDMLENDRVMGFKSGIPIIDDVIGGLCKGELTTIAARSGVGKTALALQIMLNVVEQGKKVLYISREMSSIQVFMRNITKKTGISSQKMKYKNLDGDDWTSIVKYINTLTKDNVIHINDKISTVSGIKNRIRQIKPDLVIVDYLQLLTVEEKYQSREREVASLSRELKNITLDFEIPLIQLSQLNDEFRDQRPWGERPMRDSKAIFHDSNNVVYIHEPTLNDYEKAIETCNLDRYRVMKLKDQGIKILDLIVAKCRDGGTTYRHYWYNGSRLHFEEIIY